MAFSLPNSRSQGPLIVGMNVEDGSPVSFPPELLSTGLHAIGPTGSGKSRFLLNLIRQLAPDPYAATVICSAKGSFGAQAKAVCLSAGLGRRLLVFDPGDRERVVGFNPLRPIAGIDWESQVAGCREAIRSAWNARSFSETPQLARFLHLALAVAREQELTLFEAAEMLRAQSRLREILIPRVRDEFIREALAYLEKLREQRVDELTASAIARLEGFIADSRLRAIFTQSRSLDLGEIIASRQILIVDLRLNDPLRLEQVRLVGRLLIADLVAHVFARPEGRRHPVNLILDEAALFLAPDLIQALDQGRELGLRVLLAHQHPAQLEQEDESRQIYEAVLNDARTRVLFGGLRVAALRPLVEDMFISTVDAFRVKDQITTLECEPIETTRVSKTRARSGSQGRSIAFPRSTSEQENESSTKGRSRSHGLGKNRSATETDTEGWNESFGEQRAQAVANGKSRTRAVGRGLSNGIASTDTFGSARVSATGDGVNAVSVDSRGASLLPTGEIAGTLVSASTGDGAFSSRMESEVDQESHALTMSAIATETVNEAASRQRIETASRAVSKERGVNGSRARTKTAGVNEQWDEAESAEESRSKGRSRSSGVTPSFSNEAGWSESETVQPFYAYKKRRVVSSRTFMSADEQLLEALQKVKEQPRGHFVIKTPTSPPVFVRAPHVEIPRITARGELAYREHLASLPYYANPAMIAAEEAARRGRLLPEAKPQSAPTPRTTRRKVPDRDF